MHASQLTISELTPLMSAQSRCRYEPDFWSTLRASSRYSSARMRRSVVNRRSPRGQPPALPITSPSRLQDRPCSLRAWAHISPMREKSSSCPSLRPRARNQRGCEKECDNRRGAPPDYRVHRRRRDRLEARCARRSRGLDCGGGLDGRRRRRASPPRLWRRGLGTATAAAPPPSSRIS